MELDEYIYAIETCPDEMVDGSSGKIHRLTHEFGVYDNWPIVLDTERDHVLSVIGQDPAFSRLSREEVEGRLNENFLWFRTQSDNAHIGLAKEGTLKGWLGFRKERKPYKSAVGLHSSGNRDTKNTVPVIRWFADFAKQENVGLWFPHSVGWKNEPRDYNKGVVYEP
jgi:hypothetical protein